MIEESLLDIKIHRAPIATYVTEWKVLGLKVTAAT